MTDYKVENIFLKPEAEEWKLVESKKDVQNLGINPGGVTFHSTGIQIFILTRDRWLVWLKDAENFRFLL